MLFKCRFIQQLHFQFIFPQFPPLMEKTMIINIDNFNFEISLLPSQIIYSPTINFLILCIYFINNVKIQINFEFAGFLSEVTFSKVFLYYRLIPLEDNNSDEKRRDLNVFLDKITLYYFYSIIYDYQNILRINIHFIYLIFGFFTRENELNESGNSLHSLHWS